jgi:predicted short-subunit dehydrogenase-like oxidoreductase (DUF2520 family)
MSSFCIFGTGNMAWNLSHALYKSGHIIDTVIGRDVNKAKELASKFGAFYTTEFQQKLGQNDFLILCLNDDSYLEVVEQLSETIPACVLHTSGSVGLDVLEAKFKNCGVLYPLQSFRKDHLMDFLRIPIFYEGNNTASEKNLQNIADSLSNTIIQCDSEQRAQYHLAAVWVNNFTNLLYCIGFEHLSRRQLNFDHLLPIIKETAQRLQPKSNPKEYQTGPAKRNDVSIMKKHLEHLNDDLLQKIYELLSQKIAEK